MKELLLVVLNGNMFNYFIIKNIFFFVYNIVMLESFNDDRAFEVTRKLNACPLSGNSVRPYNNLRSKFSIDASETFASTNVGSSAGGESVASMPMADMNTIRYRTGIRGADTFTNHGVETFQNTTHSNSPWVPTSYNSVIGAGSPSLLMNRPLNLTHNTNPVPYT